MPDPQNTATFALPLLMTAQAQKEITHNEALVLIDSLLVPMAESAGTDVPPETPQLGQCWLIGDNPTGAWNGQALSLACWTHGGWRFADMPVGAHVAVGPQRRWHRRTAAGWQAPTEIAPVSGGSVIDAEARVQLNLVIAALSNAGIIAPA